MIGVPRRRPPASTASSRWPTRASPLPGDQRQRLRHQVQVRQRLRLPPLAPRRHHARDRRHALGQEGRHLRLRRRRQGLGRLDGRAGGGRYATEIDPICAPRRADGHQVATMSSACRTATSSSHDRQQGHHHLRPHVEDEEQRDRRQHRHFDNEIQMEQLEKATTRMNIAAGDKYIFLDGHGVIVFAEAASSTLNARPATRRSSCPTRAQPDARAARARKAYNEGGRTRRRASTPTRCTSRSRREGCEAPSGPTGRDAHRVRRTRPTTASLSACWASPTATKRRRRRGGGGVAAAAPAPSPPGGPGRACVDHRERGRR